MLKFKDYDMLDTPPIIKEECSDAENVDENAIKCPKSEEIASIKCEEVYIKEELDIAAKQSGSYQLDDYDNLVEKGSSKRKRKAGKYKPRKKNKFCPKCPYSTDRSSYLKNHMRSHSDSEQHRCTLCSFVTDARLLLQAHMPSHRGATQKYGCRECSYETNRKNHLEQHIIKHKDISEIYKCQECSFSTKYKRHLVMHHLVHEDSRVVNKFKCEICPFRTKRIGGLRTHMKIHDKQLRNYYYCATCDHKTIYKAHLQKHTKMCMKRNKDTDDKKKK